jgi:hypothetical protein
MSTVCQHGHLQRATPGRMGARCEECGGDLSYSEYLKTSWWTDHVRPLKLQQVPHCELGPTGCDGPTQLHHLNYSAICEEDVHLDTLQVLCRGHHQVASGRLFPSLNEEAAVKEYIVDWARVVLIDIEQISLAGSAKDREPHIKALTADSLELVRALNIPDQDVEQLILNIDNPNHS